MDSAEALLEQLRACPASQLVENFRARAEALRIEFASWPQRKPDTSDRSDAIQRLIDLREQVRSYLDGER